MHTVFKVRGNSILIKHPDGLLNRLACSRRRAPTLPTLSLSLLELILHVLRELRAALRDGTQKHDALRILALPRVPVVRRLRVRLSRSKPFVLALLALPVSRHPVHKRSRGGRGVDKADGRLVTVRRDLLMPGRRCCAGSRGLPGGHFRRGHCEQKHTTAGKTRGRVTWTGGDRKIQRSRLVCTGYRRLSTRENHQYGFLVYLGANNELVG